MMRPLRLVGVEERPPELPPGACARCVALEEEVARLRDEMADVSDRLRRSIVAQLEALKDHNM